MPRSDRQSMASATPVRRLAAVKIPLNDDRQEKADRLHRRQTIRAESLRASATPMRNRLSGGLANSPSTPQNDLPTPTGNAVTPMKHVVPIRANFDTWLRMTQTNKVSAANAWDYGLIDYFHDMSLLKQGERVDFQKASVTLNGCVNIYSNRVESVTSDGDKLRSALAEGKSKKTRGGDEDDDGDEEDGEEGQKRKKRRAARASESTLAANMEQLQNKKLEIESAVDPLFKKASADLDEGGARGLLLNQLSIDSRGKIVFDSSDDVGDVVEPKEAPGPDEVNENEVDNDGEEKGDDEAENSAEEPPPEDVEIDIAGLAREFFPDLSRLDGKTVCPSLQTFDITDGDATLDLPLLDFSDDIQDEQEQEQDADGGDAGDRSGMFLDDDPMGFDDGDITMGAQDLEPEPGFGDGGEQWAKEAAIEPQARVHEIDAGVGDEDGQEGDEGAEDGEDGGNEYQYGLSVSARGSDQHNILKYFDNALKNNWAGPEHWRVRKLKDMNKAPPPTERKKKEPFEIDFLAPMSQAMADALYTPAASNSAITLPKKDRESKTKNLLPDDKYFNYKSLLTFFLRPQTMIGQPRQGRNLKANDKVTDGFLTREKEEDAEDIAPPHDYDGDFFQDEDLGPGVDPMDDEVENFVDAPDHQSPPAERAPGQDQALGTALLGTQEGALGTQPGPEYVQPHPQYLQYARRSKKVDVKKLKTELWGRIGFEEETIVPEESPEAPAPMVSDKTMQFTDVVSNLKDVYPKQQYQDISTSFCFICLLHLANEKGLVLSNNENFEDLTIRKDLTADLSIPAD